MQPFLKWAGGKRQLIAQIAPFVPELSSCTYFEPFLGAGAMLFHFQPPNAIVNDINSELITVYKVVQSEKLFRQLITELESHKSKHECGGKAYFYEIRAWDKAADYHRRSPVQKAARFIYLNKTCFNGLYRVNSKGNFNVPFGRYKKPEIVNKEALTEAHAYLRQSDIKLLNKSFEKAVADAKQGDFIYFDPPYDPLNKTSSFTSYAPAGFGKEEQVLLRDVYQELNARGCKVLLSNSDTPLIRELYQEFKIVTVRARRWINAKAEGRGKLNEVLVVGDYYG